MDVQDEISEAVTNGLRVTLTGAEQARFTKRHTDDMRAYEAYLKGRYHLKGIAVCIPRASPCEVKFRLDAGV